jgi:hypothetical protein
MAGVVQPESWKRRASHTPKFNFVTLPCLAIIAAVGCQRASHTCVRAVATLPRLAYIDTGGRGRLD